MGPYCKFCNQRCFVPVARLSLLSTDIRATCKEGMRHDFKTEIQKRLTELKDEIRAEQNIDNIMDIIDLHTPAIHTLRKALSAVDD